MRFLHYRYIPIVVAALYLGWTFYQRQSGWYPHSGTATNFYKNYPGLDGSTAVKVLQFYTASGVITEGESATICYGVVNARAVRLDPPVEPLTPSLSRCISVAPGRDTRYTLTAEGADGRTAAESFVIQVKPDPATLPRILYFENHNRQVDRHGLVSYTLCYKTENADAVALKPEVVPLGRAFMGCFSVAPRETTTYTLTAAGRKARTVERQITIEVSRQSHPGKG